MKGAQIQPMSVARGCAAGSQWVWLRVFSVLALAAFCPAASSAEKSAAVHFRKEVQPILTEYCYDCHADGANKGKVAFDEFKSEDELIAKRDLWLAVLKNVRAGLMPPEKKPHPSDEQKAKLATWIKAEVFGIDPKNPDPGRVTIRRLNRVEYRNTIRDLMGFDFKVEDELPPDDSGYGFDNIGDVLTVSPMLLEKYMQAAEIIVAGAVPRVPRVVAEARLAGNTFGRAEGKRGSDRYSFYMETNLAYSFKAEHAGSYRVVLEFEVLGQFAFDPGRIRAVLTADGEELWQKEFGWENGQKSRHDLDVKWPPGERKLALELHPLVASEKKTNSLDLRILAVRVEGPAEKEHWVRPKNFDLFFTRDVPATPAERRAYSRDILSRFTLKAFRRPVDERSLERLVAIAEGNYNTAGKRFEDGIAQAIVPVLASPRFLFRVEEPEAASALSAAAAHPFVDQYALASRLSYFLWSTMPDRELFVLAQQGKLRANLGAEVKRMLADSRSEALIENFVGQWLQVRDVEGIDINARAVIARDLGEERNMRRNRDRFQELRDIPDEKLTEEQRAELQQIRENFRRGFRNRPLVELDRDLRRALRQETEMAFAEVVRGDRSVLELIDSDYTFLNERLAKHYGLTNWVGTNFTGSEMRRVTLPKDDPRGGVLTHGAVLIVTSNPTRTSPVKRGLFVLENILGTPPPPPPPDIPNLEDSEKAVAGRQPTLRETLELHRAKPLCHSCHNRMDPLGLALENFNALGMWREKERGQAIDATGKLITGEAFRDIRDIKRVLATTRHRDFYQCLTEKLLTYALGRGLEHYDVETVDQIVKRLEENDGRFSALLMGIVESAPFQKRRNAGAFSDSESSKPVERRVEVKETP
jgi:hypothetical protein